MPKHCNRHRTETLIIERDSGAVGKTMGNLKLRTRTGVSIIAFTRDAKTQVKPLEIELRSGDIVVLLGGTGQIDRAIDEIEGAAESQ